MLFDFLKIFSNKSAFDSIKFFKIDKYNYSEKFICAKKKFEEEKKQWQSGNNIGITTPNCPYCNIKLQKFPLKKTKCKNCGNQIYVRTRPCDRNKILVKESELDLVEQEWKNANYYKEREKYFEKFTKSVKKYNTSIVDSITIDVTEELKIAFKEAINDWQSFLNYDEILRIDENDRLPLLKFIWSNGTRRSEYIYDDLRFVEFPQYNSQDLRLIAHIESFRINTYLKKNKWKEGGCIFVRYYSNRDASEKNIIRLCHINDMPFVLKEWHTENGYTDWYYFSPIITNIYKDNSIEKIYYWSCGKELEFNKEMFKNFIALSNVKI